MTDTHQRPDGRACDQLRPVTIRTDFLTQPDGHALITAGNTIVLCTASVEEQVPRWREGQGKGWITAEYSMLPGSTGSRSRREASKGRLGGRTHEIQRLIGRSLRAACDMSLLGERSVTIDCDVLQADGGTRTASITGGYVALAIALGKLQNAGQLDTWPLIHRLAAISVGIIDGVGLLDLPYVEDSRADVDMNVVMTGDGRFVELQGTAEGTTFSRPELDTMLALADKGIRELHQIQQTAINTALGRGPDA